MKSTIFFLTLLFSLESFTTIGQIDGNWGFEHSFPPGTIYRWGFSPSETHKMLTDTAEAFSGSKSLQISSVNGQVDPEKSGYFFNQARILKTQCAGKDSVTICAYIKTEISDPKAAAAVWVNVSSTNNRPVYANTLSQGGNFSKWQRVCASVPLDSQVIAVNYGGFMTGAGIAKFDQFEIFLDTTALKDAHRTPASMGAVEFNELRNLSVPLSDASSKTFTKLLPQNSNSWKIMGLGEATHGNKEFSELRTKLIQWLANDRKEDLLIAIENSPISTPKVNAYVLDGEGDISLLLKQNFFIVWQTQEMRHLMEWARSFNQSNKKKIRFEGIDQQSNATDSRSNPFFRDSCMAANALKLSAANPNKKIIIWGHNSHIGKAKGFMGSYLKDQLGTRYLAVATTGAHGSYTAYSRQGTRKTVPLQKPYPETYEFWLARLPEASFGIRLNDSQISKLGWMNQPQGFRAIGFAEQMQQFSPSDIVKNYDVLLFVKSATPSAEL